MIKIKTQDLKTKYLHNLQKKIEHYDKSYESVRET